MARYEDVNGRGGLGGPKRAVQTKWGRIAMLYWDVGESATGTELEISTVRVK
jgi:hypothetical protein